MNADEIRSVGVLGAGTMGHGIAEVAALAGLDVWVYDVQKSFLDGGLEKLRWSVAKLAEKGMISPEKAKAALERVHGTLDLEQLSEVDAVIEAVPEDLKVKSEVFSSLVRYNHRGLLASNTSTIPITEIAASTGRPEILRGLALLQPAGADASRRGDPRREDR